MCTTDSNQFPGISELGGHGIDWFHPVECDITHQVETEFVYLAVVLDAYSRRVIGWALDRTLEALAVAALKMAFRRRGPITGLTHHSDRGVQYASKEYRSAEGARRSDQA